MESSTTFFTNSKINYSLLGSISVEKVRKRDRHEKHWTVRYREKVLKQVFDKYGLQVKLVSNSESVSVNSNTFPFIKSYWAEGLEIDRGKNIGINFPCLGYQVLITYLLRHNDGRSLKPVDYLFAYLLLKNTNRLSKLLEEKPLDFKKEVSKLWDFVDLVQRKWGWRKNKLVPLISYGKNAKKPLAGYNWGEKDYRLKEDISYWLLKRRKDVAGVGGENFTFDFDHDKKLVSGEITREQWQKAQTTFEYLINAFKFPYVEISPGGKKLHGQVKGLNLYSKGMWVKEIEKKIGDFICLKKYTVLPICKKRRIEYTRWHNKKRSLYDQEFVVDKKNVSWFRRRMGRVRVFLRDVEKDNLSSTLPKKKRGVVFFKEFVSSNLFERGERRRSLNQVEILRTQRVEECQDDTIGVNYSDKLGLSSFFMVNLYQIGDNKYGRKRVEQYFSEGNIIDVSLLLGSKSYWVSEIHF